MSSNNASNSPVPGGKKTNLEPMLQLRVARANHLWESYWSNAKN